MVLPGGPKASSATFTAFLEYLLVAYPVAPKAAVICDSTMIHRSQFVQRWLAAPTRGGGVVRGTLQPHDNSVERVWAALKAWRPTRRRWPSRGASARCTPSSGSKPDQLLAMAAPHSCLWLPEDYVRKFTKAA